MACLAAATRCSVQEESATVGCAIRQEDMRIAVVISSDTDHAREALDFISSWDRFPPCLALLDTDREQFPAVVLRLSCDWGLAACEGVARQLTEAIQPHMHCFSQLILKMNIVMFRTNDNGVTVADCLEYALFAVAGSSFLTLVIGLRMEFSTQVSTAFTRATTIRSLTPTKLTTRVVCFVREQKKSRSDTFSVPTATFCISLIILHRQAMVR
jgi:Flp pilus assembly pilin Flp